MGTKQSEYNPSSWNQRIPIAIIAAVAAGIALYLGLYQWGVIATIWDPLFGEGTQKVLTSDVSHEITRWIRIPDAILGVFAYFSDLIFAIGGSKRRWQDRPWLVALFGIDVIPLGFVSIALVVMQGMVVGYWCFWCLITAAISLILIFLAYNEVYASCLYLYEVWKITHSSKAVFWTLWGYPSDAAVEAGNRIIQRGGKNVAQNR